MPTQDSRFVGGTMADRCGRTQAILLSSCVSLALSFSIGWLIKLPLWLLVALAPPARAPSPASADSTDATIFSFFLSDIVDLPFDSNSTKVGVSTYIGTNGCGARYRISPRRARQVHK